MSQKSYFSIQSVSKNLANRGAVFTSLLASVGVIMSLSIISPGVLVASSDLISTCKSIIQKLATGVKVEAAQDCSKINLVSSQKCDTPYSNMINSGLLVTTSNGGPIGSATLINNTSEDGTAYIITANHLKNESPIANMRFYYAKQSCNGTTSFSNGNYLSGATEVVSTNDQSIPPGSDYGDIMILKVAVAYSTLQANKVNLSGWSRETNFDTISNNGKTFLVHSPLASFDPDRKQIAVRYSLISQSGSNKWLVPFWEEGKSGSGSSGGGFYGNTDKLIGVQSSMSSPGQCSSDAVLGKFGAFWNNYSATSQVLDPTASGAFSLDYRATYDFNLTNYNFDNPNTNWAGGKFYTLENINAGSGVFVANGGKLDLKAKKSLVLDAGFTADYGSNVVAEVK